jgi:hypothetical protein
VGNVDTSVDRTQRALLANMSQPSPSTPASEGRRSFSHRMSSPSSLLNPGDKVPGGEGAPTLGTKPLLTLRHFSAYLFIQIRHCLHSLIVHPITALSVYPAIVAYLAAKYLNVEHDVVEQFEAWLPAVHGCMFREFTTVITAVSGMFVADEIKSIPDWHPECSSYASVCTSTNTTQTLLAQQQCQIEMC